MLTVNDCWRQALWVFHRKRDGTVERNNTDRKQNLKRKKTAAPHVSLICILGPKFSGVAQEYHVDITHWTSVSSYTYDIYHTAWCRILLEKLTGLQLVKKFPAIYGTVDSLPHSQASATRSYPGIAKSSPHTHYPPPADPS